MNKLSFNQNTGYVIEVNDRGDTIELDFEDLDFVARLDEMYSEIHRATEVLEKSVEKISKQPNEQSEDSLLSTHDKKTLEAIQAFYRKGRNAIDLAFGEGSSMAIFGHKNRVAMFHEFFEALDPHLEKSGIQVENRIKHIRDKYEVQDDKETVI